MFKSMCMRGKSSPKSEIAVAPAAGTGFETNEPMEEGLAKKKIRPNGFFKRMSDDRLIEYTQEFLKENGITTRNGLAKADLGLYIVLRRRDLLAQIGFEEVLRDWATMTDEAVIGFAQEFMKEKGITTRSGLEKADSGLHTVLKRRNLLRQTIPESKQEGYRERRDWAAMSDPELIEFTQEFMKEKGITTRAGLEKADSGLRDVLRRRNLRDRVFAEIDEKRQEESLDAVCEALDAFGEDG